MHPNTENSFRINFANQMFSFLLDILPLDSGEEDEGEGEGKNSAASVVEAMMGDISTIIPADKSNDHPGRQFDVGDKVDRKNIRPFQNCFLQEFERINKLCETVTESLINLKKANAGEMNFTETIEHTQNCLMLDRIPEHWLKWSFPTMRGLGSWVGEIKKRLEFLELVLEDIQSIPKLMWLNKLFNPLGFINSIKQQTCQKEKKPLDEYEIMTDVLSLFPEEFMKTDKKPDETVAYCCGFKIEGARYNSEEGIVEDCRPKELYTEVPVIVVKS